MADRPQITQKMIDLYDEYTHLTLDRRGFMDKLTKLAGTGAAAAAIAPMLAANSAKAQIIAADDERLAPTTVRFRAGAFEASGYLVAPAGQTAPAPTVVVVHENRGLNAHIEDVTRRLAIAGFVALAPDFLSLDGGTPQDEDQARQMISGLDPQTALQIGLGAIDFLADEQRLDAPGNGRVGAIGFCWGGAMVNQLAVHSPELDAAVAFYGRVPAAEDVPRIQARMLLHYAGLDERINAGVEGYRAALESAGKDYTIHMYDNVNHAFHNDTSEARYDRDAAELAWNRTIDFLRESLDHPA